jgi:cell division protein FtsL
MAQNHKKRNRYKIQLKLNFNLEKIKKVFYILIIILFIVLILFIKGPFFKIKNINIIKLDENVNSALIERKLHNLK